MAMQSINLSKTLRHGPYLYLYTIIRLWISVVRTKDSLETNIIDHWIESSTMDVFYQKISDNSSFVK